jgi:transposase InsO family protein
VSKRRAIILSVTVEGLSQAETARRFEVSEAWVSVLMTRYRNEAEAAFEPRSRRPKRSPAKLDEPTIKLIIRLRDELAGQGLDAGPETIRWHLQHRHKVTVSASTIRRYLIAAGRVTPEPRKRPRSSFIRFEADLPNELWQTDMCHWAIAGGQDFEILSWVDDHSRYALSVTAHARVNGRVVVEQFGQAAETHGFPAAVLSDNAMYFTTRFSGGRGGRNGLETLLASLGIEQRHSRPNHPTTCGKVERFQLTLKKWLTAQPPASNLTELQTQLDTFTRIYNQQRPHQALGRSTPAVIYDRLPKTGPTGSDAGVHYRLRRDRVDPTGKITVRHAGRLFHIGIGRAHTGTPVIALIDDLDIRIINTQTGELLRRLTLDTTRNYQPQPKQEKP